MASLKRRAKAVSARQKSKEDVCTDGVLELSVIVGYLGDDVRKEDMGNLERLLVDYCDARLVALERGDKENHLHFQMVCRARVKSPRSFGVLVRKYMNWHGKIDMVPVGKVISKVLTNRMIHTWKGMVGYCLKDSGAAHFEVVMRNISDEEVVAGKTLHSIYGKADLKSRVCITNKNIGECAYVWYKYKADRQLTATMLSTLTDMIKSAMFVPAATWIIPFAGQGMDNRRMNSYWKCMTGPLNVDRADVADVFIRRKEYVKGRYLDDDLNPIHKPNEHDDYMWEGSPPGSNVDDGSPSETKAPVSRKLSRALDIPPLSMAGDVVQSRGEVTGKEAIGTCKRKLHMESKFSDRPRKSMTFENCSDFIPLRDIAPLPSNVFLPTVDALVGDAAQKIVKTKEDFWESISTGGVAHSCVMSEKEVVVPAITKGKHTEDVIGSTSKPAWIEEQRDNIIVLSSDSESDEDENVPVITPAAVFEDCGKMKDFPPIYERAGDAVQFVVKTEPSCDARLCEHPPKQCRGRC